MHQSILGTRSAAQAPRHREEYITDGITRRRALAVAGPTLAAPFLGTSAARAAYGPGVTDKEIKLGTTATYSGPVSAIASYGEAQVAYFKMINDRGGINGRVINLISLDNAFSPPKTVEQTRKLVEDDNVFVIAGALGTPTNAAVQKYLNDKQVPNLFFTSGSERFNDPKNFPWIVPLYPSYVAQGVVYGRYLLKNKPNAKIGVMYENDDFGRDYLRGLKQALGDKAASMIVAEKPHEITDPTGYLSQRSRPADVAKWRNALKQLRQLCRVPRHGVNPVRWRKVRRSRRSDQDLVAIRAPHALSRKRRAESSFGTCDLGT